MKAQKIYSNEGGNKRDREARVKKKVGNNRCFTIVKTWLLNIKITEYLDDEQSRKQSDEVQKNENTRKIERNKERLMVNISGRERQRREEQR